MSKCRERWETPHTLIRVGGEMTFHYIAPIWLEVQDVHAQWAYTPNMGLVYTYTDIHAEYKAAAQLNLQMNLSMVNLNIEAGNLLQVFWGN